MAEEMVVEGTRKGVVTEFLQLLKLAGVAALQLLVMSFSRETANTLEAVVVALLDVTNIVKQV